MEEKRQPDELEDSDSSTSSEQTKESSSMSGEFHLWTEVSHAATSFWEAMNDMTSVPDPSGAERAAGGHDDLGRSGVHTNETQMSTTSSEVVAPPRAAPAREEVSLR